MSADGQNTAEPVEENQAPQPDPADLAIDRLRTHLERGDFQLARASLDADIGQVGEALGSRLEREKIRLRLDPAAIVVMAVCGCLLVVIMASSLFN